MRWEALLAAGVALGTSGVASGASAQIVLPHDAQPSHQIEFDTLLAVGSVEEEVTFSNVTAFALDSGGRLLASATYTPGTIAVFSPEGDFVGYTGRDGQGPGELDGPRWMWVDDSDSIFVKHRGGVSVFAPDGSFGRVMRIPGVFIGAAGGPNGDFILQSIVGRPFKRFRRTGLLVEEFGEEVDLRSRHPNASLPTVFGWSSSGAFLTAPVNEYVISVSASPGTSAVSIRRESRWFRPWTSVRRGEPNIARPSPRVVSLTMHEGLLWVLLVRSAENWAANAAHRGSEAVFLDAVLEVIEPSGGLVATTCLPNMVGTFIRDGLIAFRSEGKNGVLTVRILKPRLVPLSDGG